MCNACFLASEHRFHKYRMHLSPGTGGYCDCGDNEAFRAFARCANHSVSEEAANNVDLPLLIRNRFVALLEIIMEYALDMFMSEIWQFDFYHKFESDADGSNPQSLTSIDSALRKKWVDSSVKSNDPESYACVLYNDEIHSYAQVTRLLTKCLEITRNDANHFAMVVDGEGRSVLRLFSDFMEAYDLASKVRQEMIVVSESPLACRPIRVSVYSHQALAVQLLMWLPKFFNFSDAFRVMVCEILLSKVSSCLVPLTPMTNFEGGNSYVFHFLTNTDNLWKTLRKALLELFIKSVLMKADFKRRFAEIYVKSYSILFDKYSTDDHNPQDSVVQLSVQVFTSPQLAYYLITECDVLRVLLNIVKEKLTTKMITYEHRMILSFTEEDKHKFSLWSRLSHVVHDLQFLLHNEQENIDTKLLDSIFMSMPELIDVLQMFQDNTPCKRNTDKEHIPMEPTWDAPIIFWSNLLYPQNLFAYWVSKDPNHRFFTLRKCLSMVFQDETSSVSKATGSMKDGTVSMSYHQPMIRFIAALLEEHFLHPDISNRKTVAYDFIEEREYIFDNERYMDLLYSKYLSSDAFDTAWFLAARLIAWNCQIVNGLWKRNGMYLMHLTSLYSHSQLSIGMFYRDFQLVQQAAALADNPDRFLEQLFAYFEISVHHTFDDPNHKKLMVEDFLKFLINLLCERCIPSVGKNVDTLRVVEEDLVQNLCASPLSHSKLQKLCNNILKTMAQDSRCTNQAALDDLIRKVADFKTSQNKGEFHLKEDCLHRFNPYYYRNPKTLLSKAVEYMTKRITASMPESENNPTIVIKKPPVLIDFTQAFEPILNLLTSDYMMTILKSVLQFCCKSSVQNSWSDDHLERVFFLILLGLDEDKKRFSKDDKSFPFVTKITEGPAPGSGSDSSSLVVWMENIQKHHYQMHVESVKELYVYTMSCIRRAVNLKDSTSSDVDMDTADEQMRESQSQAQQKRKEKQEIARQKREQMMKKMMDMQRNFLAENVDAIQGMEVEDDDSQPSTLSKQMSKHDEDFVHIVGAQRVLPSISNPILTCILCQEDQEVVDLQSNPMVYSGHIQRSTLLSVADKPGTVREKDWNGLFVEPEILEGSYFSSCGHAMHRECYFKFTAVARNKFDRVAPLGDASKIIAYLCPLCQQVSNTAVLATPSLPSLYRDRHQLLNNVSIDFNDWIDGLRYTMSSTIQFSRHSESGESYKTSSVHEYRVIPVSVANMKQKISSRIADAFQLLYPTHYGHDRDFNSRSNQLTSSLSDILGNLLLTAGSIGLGLNVPSMFLERNTSDFLENPNLNKTVLPLTVAYTLQSIESYLRHTKKSLFGGLPERCMIPLKSFIHTCAFVPVATDSQNWQNMRETVVQLLLPLFPTSRPTVRLCEKHLLQLDLFTELVVLTFYLPFLFLREDWVKPELTAPTALSADHCLLRLVYTAHLIQIFLTLNPSSNDSNMKVGGGDTDLEESELDNLVGQYRLSAGIIEDKPPVGGCQLEHQLRQACLPFLRCAALFYQTLSDVPVGADSVIVGSESEFSQLTTLLNLPEKFTDLFFFSDQSIKSAPLKDLVSYWCLDPRLEAALSKPLMSYPRPVKLLISLPKDYTEILLESSQFKCSNALTTLAHGNAQIQHSQPAKCLVCGVVVCSNSQCCQMRVETGTLSRRAFSSLIGGANAHAITCSAGTGVFLRLLDCNLLLLAGPFRSGCLKPAPYVDAYGETDDELRRGNPLYLSPTMMEQLQEDWLLHRFPSVVARSPATHLYNQEAFLQY